MATKAALNTKATEIENKLLDDTTDFITTLEFNRLTNISFDVRIIEAAKIFACKNQVDNRLYTAGKNREKIKKLQEKIKKLQTFDLSYFSGKSYYDSNESPKII